MAQDGGRTNREGPSESEWDDIRPEFTRLYFIENWPLRRVRQHLRERDFDATRRMYMTRIERWGLAKKRKGPEMKWAWHMLEHRRRQGLLTEFVIRGFVRGEAYIRQYYRRHPSPAPVADVNTLVRPEGIVCRTPDPGPEPTPALTPDLPIELRYLKQYCEQSFIYSRSWRLWALDSVPADGFSVEHAISSPYRQFDSPGRLVGVVEAATQLLEAGNAMDADRLLGAMPQRLSRMLLQQHPQSPASILLMLQSLRTPCWMHRRQQFLEQFLHTVAGILPEAAPFRVMIAALVNSVDPELWPQLFNYLVEFYARVGDGQQHPQCFDTRMSRAWLFVLQGLWLQAEGEYLVIHQDLMDMGVDSSNTRLLQAALSLARVSMGQGNNEKASNWLRLVHCGIEFGEKKNVEMRAECQRLAKSIKMKDRASARPPASHQSEFQFTDDEKWLSRDHPVALLGKQGLDLPAPPQI